MGRRSFRRLRRRRDNGPRCPRGAAASEAPRSGRTPRIGYLMDRGGPDAFDEAFLQALRALGYVNGQNVAIEVPLGGRSVRATGPVWLPS